MGTRLALAVVWCLHWLPYPLLARVGSAFGRLLFLLPTERRRVALTNLALCFPQMSERERRDLARAHFAAFTRSVLDRGIAWWASRERLMRIVRIEGWQHVEPLLDRPLILLAPHFVGLDIGAQRLAAEHRAVSMYSKQKNAAFDSFLRARRNRFGSVTLVSRQEGLRPVVRAMREGLPLYYLPDMDLGERDSIFVPFFGVPAATIPALGRLARLVPRAVVIPCVTEQLADRSGYVVRFYPPWDDFPAAAADAARTSAQSSAQASAQFADMLDARRMNAFIEERVREIPAQYHWLHKRFKSRPPGEPSLY